MYRVYQCKENDTSIALHLIKLLTWRGPQWQATHVRNCSIYRIKVVFVARRKFILVDLHWLLNTLGCYSPELLCHTSPTHCIVSLSVHTAMKMCLSPLWNHIIWKAVTVLEEHTTPTSGSLLKIVCTFLVSIDNHIPNCLVTQTRPHYEHSLLKTWCKEYININYQGWVFHCRKRELQVHQ